MSLIKHAALLHLNSLLTLSLFASIPLLLSTYFSPPAYFVRPHYTVLVLHFRHSIYSQT